MQTRKVPHVDVLHGVSVADPYRWLEDSDSPEVRAWDEAQTAETRAWLDRLPVRMTLRARAKELLSVGHVGAPVSRATPSGGRRYFHVRREGAQDDSRRRQRADPAASMSAWLAVIGVGEDGWSGLGEEAKVLVARADGYDQAAFEQVISRLRLNPQKVRGAVLTGAETA